MLSAQKPPKQAWNETVESFNYFELSYTIPTPSPSSDENVDLAYGRVAEALREAWTARASQLFPDRKLWVTVDEPSDGLEFRLTLRQVAEPPECTPGDRTTA